ncbi:MAG: hypothetical protein WDM90_06885 [Ferruginibacter sp.]
MFTVDPYFTDPANTLTPDYRNWGGGLHTAQNSDCLFSHDKKW